MDKETPGTNSQVHQLQNPYTVMFSVVHLISSVDCMFQRLHFMKKKKEKKVLNLKIFWTCCVGRSRFRPTLQHFYLLSINRKAKWSSETCSELD